MGNQIRKKLTDTPPHSDTLTDYDRAQLKLYARLLDAEAEGAALSEVAQHLFGIDVDDEPERARRVHDSHLVRAHWIAEHGYRELLR
ncbi:DNA -binding domain-containing protein [Aestuariibius sp. 2305UL40-4]|uniref:DNA -binding domain-containing protein n=1 Tax=Aestuariibius violaceus TaxID=3234132 RepID=UPI00345E9B72